MTEHRIYIPETGEKFELLCRRSQLRRMVKLIEGKKIFSKKATRIPKYQIPEEAYLTIKQNPDSWLFRDDPGSFIWMVNVRPVFTKYGSIVFSGDINEVRLEICSYTPFLPNNTIVACSDVLKYGRVVND